jgi:hypothetical protein
MTVHRRRIHLCYLPDPLAQAMVASDGAVLSNNKSPRNNSAWKLLTETHLKGALERAHVQIIPAPARRDQ